MSTIKENTEYKIMSQLECDKYLKSLEMNATMHYLYPTPLTKIFNEEIERETRHEANGN